MSKTQDTDLERRLGTPAEITFPEGYTTSESWKRAQSEQGFLGPIDAGRWKVKLEQGQLHEVLFTILDGRLRAECSCKGYQYGGFCAHIARLWLKWTRCNLAVHDHDTGRTHLHPPAWIRVDDREISNQ